MIDGVPVSPDNYTTSNKLTIELKPTYLETLAVGEHKITSQFDGGYAVDAKFTVTVVKNAVSPSSLPQTGDNSNLLFYAFAGIVAVAGIVLITKQWRQPKHFMN